MSSGLLIVINFLSIIVLFGMVIYVVGEQTRISEDMELAKEYDRINERQLSNLIYDVNQNDKRLQSYIEQLQNTTSRANTDSSA